MDSFELSKIAAAVLAALLLIFGMKVIIDARMAPYGEEQVGYRLPTDTTPAATAEAPPAADADTVAAASGAEPAAAAAPASTAPASETPAAGAAAPAAPPAPAPAAAGGSEAQAVVALLASASAEDGAVTFRRCVTCHTNKKDAPSTVAPNLWNVVGSPKAGHADFASKYSDAMKAKGGEWSYESLAEFIRSPRGYIPGTKMIFQGIKDPAEIANLIAYLRTLADTPAPLPN